MFGLGFRVSGFGGHLEVLNVTDRADVPDQAAHLPSRLGIPDEDIAIEASWGREFGVEG